MKSLSEDIRLRVVTACKRGESCASVAARFVVNVRTVEKLWKRYRETGSIMALPRGGYRRSRIAGMEDTLRAWIKAEPDLTLSGMCERLAEHGIAIKVPALWHQLNKWNLTFKKNPARQRAITRGRTAGAARMDRKPAYA